MTKIDVLDDEGKPVSIYIDDKLREKLETSIKEKIVKKDKDLVWIFDGDEGAGKSTFAFQVAKVIDPSFNLKRVCMNATEFIHAVSSSDKGQVIIYDEAYTGLSSRGALSEINNLLVSMMMEMRQKNLIVFIVIPTFFMLDKYVAIWRAKGLFHVYEKRGQRGFWIFYNKRKKKLLYLKGKKEYTYKGVKSSFKGRFLDGYIINRTEYIKKKEVALKSRDRKTKSEKYVEQRNRLLYLIYHNFNISFMEMGDMCKKYSIALKKAAIAEIVSKIEKEGIKNES